VVVAYERNTETNARLVDAAIEVLPIGAAELGTGRGGPRCMSWPAARDSLSRWPTASAENVVVAAATRPMRQQRQSRGVG